MFIEPKVTSSTYVSYFFSGYNAWFKEWGYPSLDIVRQEDGTWGIIQALQTPVVPCLTPWTWVLTPMKHREINPWIAKKFVDNMDLEKKYAWDELERKEEETKRQLIREELHVNDMVTRQFNAIKSNPDLMNRIAKNGVGELALSKISRHIPNHKFRKADKKPAGVPNV